MFCYSIPLTDFTGDFIRDPELILPRVDPAVLSCLVLTKFSFCWSDLHYRREFLCFLESYSSSLAIYLLAYSIFESIFFLRAILSCSCLILICLIFVFNFRSIIFSQLLFYASSNFSLSFFTSWASI